MLISELAQGTPIHIIATIEGQQFEFDSRIADSKKNDVYIEAIRMDERLLNIQGDNVGVELMLMREDDKPILWEDVEVVCKKYKGKIYYAVDRETRGKEYNRRGEYRLFIGEEVHAHVGSRKVDRIVLLKDISNGGFSFIYDQELENAEGAFVYMSYSAIINEKRKELPLFGKVVRQMELPDGRTLYGCVLMKKNDLISVYINQRQMEMISKKRS